MKRIRGCWRKVGNKVIFRFNTLLALLFQRTMHKATFENYFHETNSKRNYPNLPGLKIERMTLSMASLQSEVTLAREAAQGAKRKTVEAEKSVLVSMFFSKNIFLSSTIRVVFNLAWFEKNNQSDQR